MVSYTKIERRNALIEFRKFDPQRTNTLMAYVCQSIK